jgi:glycosyltransferase involved in cell wall biosynthesis
VITIDARWLGFSGMGTYLRNVLPRLIDRVEIGKIALLCYSADIDREVWMRNQKIELIRVKSPMYSLKEQLEIPFRIPSNTSLFFATHYNIPLLYRGPLLVTIYDLLHVARPDFVRKWHQRRYARTMFSEVRKRAAAIITISDFTKSEYLRLYPNGSQDITSIHLGVEPAAVRRSGDSKSVGPPYILFVGNVKPHKNLSTLFEAFSSIGSRVPHNLVVVGKREGFITGDARVREWEARLGGRIVFTGPIDDRKLSEYYGGASVFVFPSLYEGFGLPPLEAMAAGCPVVASKAAAIPEVCGDAAMYFDPHSVEDLARQLLLVCSDSRLRDQLRERGYRRITTFRWENCISQTASLINGLVPH